MRGSFKSGSSKPRYPKAMNIKVTLRQVGRRFRPNLPEPTTPEEARRYGKAMEVAEKATQFFTKVEKDVEKLRNTDNLRADLNSKPGIVATSQDLEGENPLDELVDSKVLKYKRGPNILERYDRLVEGTVYRGLRPGDAVAEPLSRRATTSYTESPLLMEEIQRSSLPEDSSRAYEFSRSLKAVDGNLVEFRETINNGL